MPLQLIWNLSEMFLNFHAWAKGQEPSLNRKNNFSSLYHVLQEGLTAPLNFDFHKSLFGRRSSPSTSALMNANNLEWNRMERQAR